MTESQITPSTPVPASFDGDAFDEWIAGATISKRSVPIYGKPGLYAEYEDLERQYEKAKALEPHQGEMAGSELSRIEKRMTELYEEWVDSKSTWTVHALDDDAIDAIKAQEPALVEPKEPVAPTPPTPLPAKHTVQDAKNFTLATQEYEAARAVHLNEFEAYKKVAGAYHDELNLRAIAAAVERVEFANGRVADSVSVEQVRALKKQLGVNQVLSLATAATLAAMQEPEIPAPFSRSASQEDPTS